MIATITQRLFYFPCRLFFKIFWGLKIHGVEHVTNIQKPILIIANHRTLLDSWLIGASLPFRSDFFPVRYIGGSKFNQPLQTLYSLGIITFIYRFFGAIAIPPEAMSLEEKIQPIVAALKRGEIVLMFPEGRRHYHDGIGEFKRGAAEVALRTGVPILPIAHRPIGNAGRKKTVLAFGKPIRPIVQDNASAATAEFYSAIVRLYSLCVL